MNTVDSLPWMINGDYQLSLSVTDRGFHYGDGLFETLRVNNQVVVNYAEHLLRLDSGLKTLNIPAPLHMIESHLAKYLRDNALPALSRLKIIVSRGGPAAGYVSEPSMQATIAIGAAPYKDIDDSKRQGGITLRFCTMRLSSNSVLAGIKHLNRLEQVLARSEWQDDSIFEGLMFDADDSIVEGTMSNLFLVENSVLKTPKLDNCGVRGVMRGVIIDCIAPELGLRVEELTLSRDNLRLADEVFISNSLIGAVPVRQCEEFSWSPGPVCSRIQNAIAHREYSAVHYQ
ncbi:MAG: aminodeoxychorismate lyase [Pseudomonadales bacterium]